MNTLNILFLVLVALVCYTYVGYGIILWLLVKCKRFINGKNNIPENMELPTLTVLIAAWNEEDCIEEKIKNTLALNYPCEKITFLFISDGSTDKTPDIIRKYKNIILLHEAIRKGKTAAINRAMKQVTSDIVVFSDANTLLNENALLEIVKHYNNPRVGCVAGEKRVRIPDTAQASAAGEGMYWKYESKLKQWDAELYSAAGAAGELFSIRTKLFTETEEDTILDDFLISLRIVEKGYTIAYEANAYALENSSEGIKEELKRKIRICAGGFQSIIRLSSLLNIFTYHIFTFQYVSHRVLRWTLAPLSLFLLFPLNAYLAYAETGMYAWIWILQILFYAMAYVGWRFENRKIRKKIFFIPFYFILMNYSVLAGFNRYITGGQSHMWLRAKRAIS